MLNGIDCQIKWCAMFDFIVTLCVHANDAPIPGDRVISRAKKKEKEKRKKGNVA